MLWIGKYKSLAEPFTNKPAASLEMFNAMVNTQVDSYSHLIAKNRKSTNSKIVLEWIEKSMFTANNAVVAGIVDKVSHYSEFKKTLVANHIDKNAESLSFNDPNDVAIADITDYKEYDELNNIALLRYSGDIHMASTGEDNVIYPEKVKKDIDWVLERPEIKAAVIRISSPGGSALASEIIWNDINRLKQKIPSCFHGFDGCYGGYYMASAAHKVVAESNTITGSIGVIGMLQTYLSLKNGISSSLTLNLIGQRFKPWQDFNSQDKKILSGSIEEIYDLFLDRVAKGRNMGKKQVDAIAQGRVWTGLQAKGINLVDEVGGTMLRIKWRKN